MKSKIVRLTSAALTLPLVCAGGMQAAPAQTASAVSGSMCVEYLDRGISAVGTGSGILVSWRWLASDSDDAEFRLYRDGTLIYTSTSGKSTCFLDSAGNAKSVYRVDSVSGSRVLTSDTCKLQSSNAYFDIRLDQPAKGADGGTYSPNDISVGDVDGDGQYELFVKWDPSTSKDNSQKGKTDKVYIDCYRLDGTKLWRIDLGVNIRAGAHYTQFYVADFDLDGKCEMTCKTSDGTVDGTGKVIGDASKVYRDSSGLIYTGNEFYTLFDGATGAALDTINYEPGRGDPTKWGKSSDKYNRVERYWGTVAYLDGVHPSVVTGRGYYGRMTATAYAVENKKLKKLWAFDTGTSTSAPGYGDGNHNSMAADVDGDGRQEICTGAAIIDDNGTLYYTTGQGHGDALHLGDLDPSNPGLEVWICHEESKSGYGVTLVDCDQKKILYHQNGAGDTGRCCADNVWAGNPGAECWGNKLSDNSTPVVNTAGQTLNCRRPAINFLSYWDGDLEREILDGYTDSPATISKLTGDPGKTTLTTLLSTDGYYTCNTTKGTPCLSADIFGDWREELIVRKADGTGIRIYCTPYGTDYRITTLMHDPQYRTQVSSQQTAYNQPPHPSFYLGSDQPLPARPNVTVNGGTSVKTGAVMDTAYSYTFRNVNSGLYLASADAAPSSGTNVQQGKPADKAAYTWTLQDAGDGYYYIYSALNKNLCIDLPYGSADNGTSIGLWSNDESDARRFKFIDNGDGSYTICTKSSADMSCFGVISDSKEDGADVIQWTSTGNDSQKWIVSTVLDPLNGTLIREFDRLQSEYAGAWSIESGLSEGALVYGDRDVTYTAVPDALSGAEYVRTPCDAKNLSGTLAEFTVSEPVTVYAALDSRVEQAPAWLSGWTKTDLALSNSNNVSFVLYAKEMDAGESVVLGENGQTSGCVNYTVAVVPKQAAAVTGDINADGVCDKTDVVMMRDYLLTVGTLTPEQAAIADMNSDGRLNAVDLTLLKQMLMKQ